jgi:hypothetical protein
LSFRELDEIIKKENPEADYDVNRDLLPMMGARTVKAFHSARKSLDPNKRRFSFELFGLDFILDADFNVWLIEVNTNPGLEATSQNMKDFFPRMVDEMLQLTADRVFPKSTLKRKGSSPKKNKAHIVDQADGEEDWTRQIKSLQGHADGENLWVKLSNLDKDKVFSEEKESLKNIHHKFNLII